MDCGNNPCDFAQNLRGQRTQGRCRCWDELERVPGHEMRRRIRIAMSDSRAALATRDAEIEKLKADLVWALEKHAYTTIDKTVVVPHGGRVGHWDRIDTERDPVRILAAVRAAREGKK